MKKLIYLYIFITSVFIFSNIGMAAPPAWKVDQAHSGVYFRVNHIYSKVSGFFPDFEGDIIFDPTNLNESRFAFKVKVKGINTNNSKRDGHLLSDEFFDAKKYPEMSFESRSITKKQGNQYIASGEMKIKDVTRTIEVPFTFFGTKSNPFNPKQEVAGFEAQMTIDRLTYNIGNGQFVKKGVVGKDVEILVSLEALRDK